MDEILPGIWSWKGIWERDYTPFQISARSYYLAETKTVIDPISPPEGFDWFNDHRPENIILTTTHHCRHTSEFIERFGCQLYSPEGEKLPIQELNPRYYKVGDTVVPAIHAYQGGGISGHAPVLHIATGEGALVMGDILVRFPDDGSPMPFPKEAVLRVPDRVVKQELSPVQRAGWSVLPKGMKRRLLTKQAVAIDKRIIAALTALVHKLEFDALLFTHGDPILRGGKSELTRLLAK